MKKILYILSLCCSLFSIGLVAQPTWDMPTIVVPNMGDNFCLPIEVMDFTDLQEIRFSINFDPDVVTFTGATNFNPAVPNLNASTLDISMKDQGILIFVWAVDDGCNANFGITLDDMLTLFELCFDATGIYGDHTVVNITSDPEEKYVSRLNANCNDIGEFCDSTHVNVEVQPLKLTTSSTNGNAGDIVCVSISVEDFVEMISVQYSINWDPTKLALIPNGITPTDLLPSFNVGPNISIADAPDGVVTVSWFDPDDAYSLPDGTNMLDLCFEILAGCGDEIPILITEVPTIFEAVNKTSSDDPQLQGKDMGIFPSHGEVTVNCFTPGGIEINIPDYNANPGESFCLDVTTGANWENLSEVNFTLSWNPSVINLTNALNILEQNASCPQGFGFDFSTFPSQGYLTFQYKNNFPGCDLNPNELLFKLCFQAIGPGGSSSNVSIVNSPVPILADLIGGNPNFPDNIGINADNGLVQINQLQGITVIAEMGEEAQPGQQVCVDFTVQDFKDVEFMNFTINWETDVLEFAEVTNFGLPDMSQFNFLTTVVGSGALGVEWGSTPTSVLDNEVIFTVCFDVIGDPGQCSPISIGQVPYPIDVQTTGSNGTNVGLNDVGSEVCTLDPFSFETHIGDAQGTPNSIACVDFAVTNFNQLTNMEYAINWDPNFLEYDHVELTGGLLDFTTASYDDDILLVDDGRLVIDWESGNGIFGTSVPDGTVIFQVCFKIKGFFPNCGPIIISDNPQFIRVTSATTGPSNIGLFHTPGEICATDGLDVSAIITEEECVGSDSGVLDITVEGGSGNYLFDWENDDTGEMFSTEDLNGVPAGTYKLTVCDVPNPNICHDTIFTIGITPNATIADAGPDVFLPCGGGFLANLDNSGSSSGPDIEYLWTIVDGSPLILSGDETIQNPTVIGVGCFEVTVTNTVTGCVTTDQVCTLAPQSPSAELLDPETIKCDPDTVLLDASLSTNLPNYTITWVPSNGGSLADPSNTDVFATALTAGDYTIIITNQDNGCTASATKTVLEDVTPPIAEAGDMKMLICGTTDVELDGSTSSSGNEFTYQWEATVNGDICGITDAMNLTVCAPGTYELLVTNTDNGCTATDFVQVEADTMLPNVSAGLDKILNCEDLTLVLDGTGSSGTDYSYQWSTTNGGFVSGETTLNPEIDQPGTYTLVITNNSNNCESQSEVFVDEDKDVPVINIVNNALLLTCDQTTDTLDGTGSILDADIISEWFDEGGLLLTNDLKYEISSAGTYTLVITNETNKCSTSADVVVTSNQDIPSVNAGAEKTLTCAMDTAVLEGTTNANAIQWSNPDGGIVSGANTLTPTVNMAGVYTMTVVDTVTGCLAESTVVVDDDFIKPEILVQANGIITCQDPCTDIEVNVINGITDYSVEWTKVSDGSNVGSTDLVNVCESTSYSVIVTNNENGCSADAAFITPDEDVTPPIAMANNTGDVTCLQNTSVIDATGSDLAGTTVLWSTTDGLIPAGMENDVMVSVPNGTYTILITNNTTGCTATAETIVGLNNTAPVANAGADVPKDCGVDIVTLDGTASTMGGNISYQWYFLNTINEIPGATNTTVDVSDVGEYILIVTNDDNGCTAESFSNVFDSMEGGDPAQAIVTDMEPCTDISFLSGNLPDGATGIWSLVSGSADLSGVDLTSPDIMVSGLQVGTAVFEWTLSLGVCDNYSSALVSVEVISIEPDAKPDVVSVKPDDSRTVIINALENDEYSGGSINFSIVSNPDVGTIDNIDLENGIITYSAPAGFFGAVEIAYEICDKECPDQCDVTFIQITYILPDAVNCDEVPSGITPNGDGVNDEFYIATGIDFIYPDNSLIIFNRWGDVVYEKSPYTNDWRGTNESGDDLPAGTYYYILRLDLGQSEICKGDITIMR